MAAKPKLIIIGIDGATWEVAVPYIEAGRLPGLKRLVEEGAWGVLRSIHPPVTGCCWPTIFTGTNPGKHGVFDFFATRDGTYERRPVTLLDWRQPPLWQLLNDNGLSVGVFNVPITFPAQAVRAYMVSGEMGTPTVDERMFWPREVGQLIGPQLRRYQLGPIWGTTGHHRRRLARQIVARNEAALALAKHLPTDVTIIVLNYVDHAQHFFWHQRFDGLRRHGESSNPVLRAYEAADRLLCSLQQSRGSDCTTVVLSDHGAGATAGYLDLDRMLASLGYLRFAKTRFVVGPGRVPQALRPMAGLLMKLLPSRVRASVRRMEWQAAVDYHGTRAFSVGACGGLRVNLCGRERAGGVPAADLEHFCLQLSQVLGQIEGLDGEQLFEVHLNSELYDGPHVGLGPDLIAVPQCYAVETIRVTPPRCNWLVSRTEAQALGLPQSVRSGGHRLEGIVAVIGPGVEPGSMVEAASIVDVAPTVMALLGLSPPQYMDGHIMRWLCPNVCHRASPERPAHQPARPSQQPQPYTAGEQAAVTDRLKQLGYLD